MAWINYSHHVPFVSQGNDSTACWVACVAMLMHFKEGQFSRKRPSAELCTMFRQFVSGKGLNIPGTIQPAQIVQLANIMGLRYCMGTPTLSNLTTAMATSPVALFGNYHSGPGSTLMHATVAYKLRGNTKSTIDLNITGHDPQGSEPGTPYTFDFLSFNDPSMPQASILKRVDYMVYC